MNRLIRFTGLTLAIALSIAALLPSSAAAVRFCYCEVYCSDGSYSFGQAANRIECAHFAQQQCGGSATSFCSYY